MKKRSKRFWSEEEVAIIDEYGTKGEWKATKVARWIHSEGLLLNRSHEQVVWQLRFRRPRKKISAPPVPVVKRPPGYGDFRYALPKWLSPAQRATALEIATKAGVKAGERYLDLCEHLRSPESTSIAS